MSKRYAAPPDANALFAQLFVPKPTKGQRRVLSILDAAIDCYATVGIDGTTFDTIAKAAKVSRPLVQHYFETKRDIFAMVVRYVRASFQAKAIEAIRSETKPIRQLEAYIRSTFVWVREQPRHALVWKLFFYYCGLDEELRAINTELVKMGEARITAMLEACRKAGELGKAPPGTAKQIQALITGALMTLTTEDHSPAAAKAFIEASAKNCLRLARLDN